MFQIVERLWRVRAFAILLTLLQSTGCRRNPSPAPPKCWQSVIIAIFFILNFKILEFTFCPRAGMSHAKNARAT